MDRSEIKACKIMPGTYALFDPKSNTLKVFEEEGIDDAYVPAKSISIPGRERIENLRDFLNEHYPKEREAKNNDH